MAGVDAKNIASLDPEYKCSKCKLILQDPVQLSACGHRQWQSCFGAQPEATIMCLQCSTEVLRHQEHLDQSHPNPNCEHCDKQFNCVDKLNEHKMSECQNLTANCVVKEFGCNDKIARDKMREHYLTLQHQETLIKVVHKIESQLFDTNINTDSSSRTTAIDVELLADSAQRVRNKSFHPSSQDSSEVKLSEPESHGFWEGIKQNLDILNQHLTSLNEKINDLQYVSYDGTFVWKITNFLEKMMDAQSERQTSIYSPPFYSSPTGYKMCARLYLHGDGNAHRTHMSLFFVLMRGLNDPILKFPFNYKVTFCMYDQTPAQRHIIDSFRPDIRSTSFQRPRSDMNIASGIPKFFPLSMIEQENNPYVRDDTMFIKVMVDFDDMPKAVLPYALSLNPGYPTHIRQSLIKEEAERKTKQQPFRST